MGARRKLEMLDSIFGGKLVFSAFWNEPGNSEVDDRKEGNSQVDNG